MTVVVVAADVIVTIVITIAVVAVRTVERMSLLVRSGKRHHDEHTARRCNGRAAAA